ncbi:MAG: prolipoprotein diacylglyceryl transferase [Candidatus Raymondbacteria bacterium RifOxyA12_full_50_37]|uniref:Phosphatidylglycerol--prolipoprotein diacylglyceryl transferase n=1 Tax=Candidatus Raymondbacteria bacterium RIFOXYD12_FULL_49_13 TaxID=1817890 RepID=A0A1F7F4G7_UNCRA|nr:MAG: prolipoprotein diacylglyceryl transferase [Candidatus Raymondbacteria bacterium RifOxyA12_full_50_37]OGJ86239.1 MAG: prolipoprotein diacylglyceryl transferase [Candidatus Raymondbacteria bacterium RIFOXYA2_FULL_49_16]OGJ95777.1 MAG: prolipoprotein diacylglyceryl transferase [Candidatus Raymondbacteria bacterium RIFOXYC2_FULL_50_21]OGK01462.1 MAG: prolipoprotein diacylglyceryl transferase [Candidatus Raymondbacteria bacterium RIFOXYD12_FULL_49_13]OGK03468.1 MAG: prolipoprotein diacylglyc
MIQTLFQIGPFAVHTYGLCLAAGFLIGYALSVKRAKQAGFDPAFIGDLLLFVIAGAILGARILYVALNFSEFKGDLFSIINPMQDNGTFGCGGLVFIGGLICASATTIAYMLMKKKPVLATLDIVVPGVAFGLAIGRIGCLLNGCCFGKACTLPWGMSFPADSPAGYYQAAVHAAHLHPSQIYMTLGALTVGLLLLALERYKRFNGHTTILFVIFYGIDRSIVDCFRYYPRSELHAGFTHNQIVLFIASVILAILFAKKWSRP